MRSLPEVRSLKARGSRSCDAEGVLKVLIKGVE